MKEHFLTYEQSLAVKELGFDEPCLAVIDQIQSLHIKGTKRPPRGSMLYDEINCPLKSQFFKWVRDKKITDSCVCRYQGRDDGGVYYYYVINHDFGVEETKHHKEGFYSYEEAEDACINKIIEILKAK